MKQQLPRLRLRLNTSQDPLKYYQIIQDMPKNTWTWIQYIITYFLQGDFLNL